MASTDPAQDQTDRPEQPECSECGIDTQQFRRLRAFAKQVVLSSADTLGTVASAQIALDGDLDRGNASLVGRNGFSRAKPGVKAPEPKPVPQPKG